MTHRDARRAAHGAGDRGRFGSKPGAADWLVLGLALAISIKCCCNGETTCRSTAKSCSRCWRNCPNPCHVLKDLHIFLHWVIASPTDMPWRRSSTAHAGDTCTRVRISGPARSARYGNRRDVRRSDDALRLGMVKACLNGSAAAPHRHLHGQRDGSIHEMVKHCPSCFIGHFTQAEIWRAGDIP